MLGLRWLYPGMGLKRWFALLVLSLLVLVVGFSGLMSQHTGGIHWRPPAIVEIEDHIKRLKFADWFLILLSLWGIVFAIRRSQFAILTFFLPSRESEFVNIVYQKTRLKRGPRIVAVGGGTGLPNVLSSLKHFTSNLTAVVTVADDGGSSGRLRRQFGTPPPGDIRNCIVALSDRETVLNDLFQYRFKGNGYLKGHSFGNLFITAMREITGDFGKAVEESSRVLSTRGTVMPVSSQSMTLQARLKNGKIVTGESNISSTQFPIAQVMFKEKNVKPNREVLKAILEADAVVLGPGSLYTSVLPNLLVPGVAENIALSRAVKIYVCNVMTQRGETDTYTVSDHVRTLLAHTGPNFVHYVIANKEAVPSKLLQKYGALKQEPVVVDEEEVAKLGPKLVKANLLSHEDYVRHSPEKLGKAILRLLVI